MGCIMEIEGITNAIKARDLLRKNRLNVSVEKRMGAKGKGCSYVLRVKGDCVRAGELLKNAGII